VLRLVCQSVSYEVMCSPCIYQCSGRKFSPLLAVVVMQWCQNHNFLPRTGRIRAPFVAHIPDRWYHNPQGHNTNFLSRDKIYLNIWQIQEWDNCVSNTADRGVDVYRVWLRTRTEDVSSPGNAKFCSRTNRTSQPVGVNVLIEKSRKNKTFSMDILRHCWQIKYKSVSQVNVVWKCKFCF